MNVSAEDRIALKDVLASYGAGLDDGDYDLYTSCFHPDVEVHGMGPQAIYGRDNWLEFVKKAMSRYSATQHLMGAQLATIDGDTASTRTDLQATHFLKDGENNMFVLWATYRSDMVKVDDKWCIKRHELVVRGSQTI